MSRSTPVRFSQGLVSIVAGFSIAAIMVTVFGGDPPREPKPKKRDKEAVTESKETAKTVKARPAPEFIDKGTEWLIKAQHKNGGWGAGSHAHQEIRDAHAVQVDPATTAFVASALLRRGHTPVEGKYKDAVRSATEYLCGVVEEYTAPGPKITDLSGTQIQAKLGPLVDTAMTAQYLARVLTTMPKKDQLHQRVDKALDKCLAKLRQSQQKDGSWNVGGGWASVLQSSLACSAYEFAQAAGKEVDRDGLAQARKYNLDNFDRKTGATKTEAAAGVALYAFAGSLRANAAQAKAADDYIEKAKREGKLSADAEVSEENLVKAGAQPQQVQALVAANSNVTAQSGFLNGSKSYGGGVGGVSSPAPIADVAASSIPAEIASTTGPSIAPATPVAAPAVVTSGPAPASVATVAKPSAGAAPRIAGKTYGGETAATTEEALLAGFGNNGGEEFLSYMLAAESMVILGEKEWNNWYDKMGGRLSKVQNPDGSWSGHHCITSPVFCTAAVVQTMTADHDAAMLAKLAKEAATVAKADVKEETKE
jgi:hypothetical protein